MALGMLAADATRAEPPAGTTEETVAWKRRELLRIAAGDLARGASVETTTADLASMAATVLEQAHATAAEHLATDDRLSVIGMGKLGGAELNYASDVDVTLVGRGDPDRLERAGRTLLDHAGRSFRVDLDLRPEGRDGPLVRSLESYEAYWERWALPWERQALLKAVPVAGDRELGVAWATAAARVLWDGPFGADDLRHVRALKVRAEAEGQRRGGAERDVKRGPGGIRDVEFAAQLLQLVHGRVDADLRVPGTLAALDQLSRGRLRRSRRRGRPSPTPTGSSGAWSTCCSSMTSGRRTRCPSTATDAAGWPACSGSGAHRRRDRPRPSTASWPAIDRECARSTSGSGSDPCWPRCPASDRSASSPPPSDSRRSGSRMSSAPARR